LINVIYGKLVPTAAMDEISVDQQVLDFIRKEGKDYRVSTDCSGPVLLSTDMKPPKSSDIRIPVGKNTLYISRVQARYIDRVTMDMLYVPGRGIGCFIYDE
jgi:hypothetical protein